MHRIEPVSPVVGRFSPRSKRDPDAIRCRLCGREMKAIGWPHLHHKHGVTGEHPIEDYKRRFRLRRAWSETSLRVLSASQIERHSRLGRHWSPERILASLRARVARGQPVSRIALEADKRGGFTWAARQRFGSWKNALLAAGVPRRSIKSIRRWTSRSVIGEIQQRWRAGKPVYSHALQRDHLTLFSAAERHFGGWKAALKAAGIPVSAWTSPVLRWTASNVLETMRQRVREGKSLCFSAVDREDPTLYAAARNYWGNWRAALKAAGIPKEKWVTPPRKWTVQRVVDGIRSRFESGKPVHSGAVSQDDRFLYVAAQRWLGGWLVALKAAGVPEKAWRRDRAGS